MLGVLNNQQEKVPDQEPKNNGKLNLIKKGKLNNAYLKYSGLAFQIIGALVIGVFVGKKLDVFFENEKQLLAGFVPILFLFAVFYKLFKELTSK